MTSPKLDFTFDARVADRYDAQRALPAEASASIGKAIAEIVGPSARVLELGVGTGRIAVPVAAAGCHVTGIDISQEMLDQLDNQNLDLPLELVQGDITDLPFEADEFDAVTAVHVFHLVDNWQTVIEEMSRVLKPQATVVMGRDWTDPESLSGQLQNHFRRAVMTLAQGQLKPPAGWGQIGEKLAELDIHAERAGSDDIVAAEWDIEMSPAQFIEGVRNKSNPESWILSDELMEPVVEQLTEAAAAEYPNLEDAQPVRRRFLLTVFRRS